MSQNNIPQLKVTRHLCFKNSKKLQLLDIQACNSANRAAFQNPTNTVLCWVGVIHQYMLEWRNFDFKVSKLVKSLLSLPLNRVIFNYVAEYFS